MATRQRVAVLAIAAATIAAAVGLALARHGGDRGSRTTAPVTSGLRRIDGRAVESPEKPKARVEIVDPAFRYAGGHRFVLYGVANAEQHVFADADEQGRVRRLYWLQFEGYLGSALFGSYDYSSSEARAEVSGLPFFADAGVRGPDVPAPKKGTDGAMMRQLLAAHGLSLPREALFQRLVWVDEGRRDELMFVYFEDLAPLGISAADLGKDGKAGRLAEVKQGLLARATAGVRLVR